MALRCSKMRGGILAGLAAFGVLATVPPVMADTVRMWTFLNPDGKTGREVVLKQLITKFEAAHAGTKIVVEPQNFQTMAQKFYAAAQAGSAPDAMFIYTSSFSDGVKIGAFANLDDLFVKGMSKEDLADIDGPFWRYGATPTGHYQVPNSPTAICQFYRPDLFKEAGIDPASLTTWDKFIAAAEKLTQKDANGTITRWSFGQSFVGTQPLAPLVVSTLLSEDGDLFDKDLRAHWATPAGVKGLQLQVDTIRKYKLTPDTAISMGNDDLFDQFNAGHYAMIRGSATRLGTAIAALGPGKVSCLPTPSFTGQKYSPTEVGIWSLVVWSGSKVKDMAGQWVQYMASKEADTLWSMQAGLMPLRKSTIAEHPDFFNDPKNAYLVAVAKISREDGWLPPLGAADGFEPALNAAMQDVLTYGTDPKAALQKAEAAYDRASRH